MDYSIYPGLETVVYTIPIIGKKVKDLVKRRQDIRNSIINQTNKIRQITRYIEDSRFDKICRFTSFLEIAADTVSNEHQELSREGGLFLLGEQRTDYLLALNDLETQIKLYKPNWEGFYFLRDPCVGPRHFLPPNR